jgi:transcriptional regulator with XRE-family HTH domain
VDIGPALAAARTEAGLTIEDVSDRTRIRRTIISDIERDDYSSCGGDFYARGHIRAIAKVVGTDPVPLIEKYDADAARAAAPAGPVTGPDPKTWWRATAESDSGQLRELGLEPAPHTRRQALLRPDRAKRPSATRQDASTLPQPAIEPAATKAPAAATGLAAAKELGVGALRRTAARAATAARGSSGWATTAAAGQGATAGRAAAAARRTIAARGGSAAVALRAAAGRLRAAGAQASTRTPMRPRDWRLEAIRQAGAEAAQRVLRPGTAGRRASLIMGGVAIGLAAVIGLTYALVSGPARSAASSPPGRHASAGRIGRRATGRPSPAAGTTAPLASGPAVPLKPVRAVAFGPGGLSQGDNPQLAWLTITGKASSGWQTNWYTTANFGGLQSGTGLLLDFGRAVAISSATIRLGAAPGSQLELRVGNVPVLADLRTVARSAGSGTLTIDPQPAARGRYLLIWFTRLPPDSSGSYQATIYHVSLRGTG